MVRWPSSGRGPAGRRRSAGPRPPEATTISSERSCRRQVPLAGTACFTPECRRLWTKLAALELVDHAGRRFGFLAFNPVAGLVARAALAQGISAHLHGQA